MRKKVAESVGFMYNQSSGLLWFVRDRELRGTEMLLFSTMLGINERMTKDEFIRLVIEWNQKSPH